jgi:hypothetical protein
LQADRQPLIKELRMTIDEEEQMLLKNKYFKLRKRVVSLMQKWSLQNKQINLAGSRCIKSVY